MALRAFLITVIVAAVVAPSLATDYMVGDDAGWKVGVNYTAWAEGKEFYVGDTLMFMYKSGSHNVMKVNGPDFQKCASSNATAPPPLTSGNDLITLSAPGKKWYICTFADHCTKGMKLVITVSAAEGPSPTPIPGWAAPPSGNSAPSEVSPLKSSVWMLALMAAYKMIMA
ncbi:hypothetical protein DH2020_036136 [Rehmannia glutinosa]|uniref:Phytocyanin domain-containing protein n=1 Tax=Rehmannia glutinosa TaxID=99300 RepID=A0ABR0V7Y1_REHGL